jgi:hypothetical protein
MKQSTNLAIASWLSVIVLAWLFILRVIESDWLSWLFFGFFFVVAVFSSAISSKK